VNDRLKGSLGNFEELMSLQEKNPEAEEFLCDFWWRRTLKACSEEVDRAIKKRLKSLPFNSTEEQKRKAASDSIDDVSHCIYSYIFDNWDDINQTIVDSYNSSKQDQKAE
jgi:protein tyrosine phosphatase